MTYVSKLASALIAVVLVSCGGEVLPKPKAFLSLDYDKSSYEKQETPCAFNFEMNQHAKLVSNSDCSFQIEYPKMKATVYLTYQKVNNDLDKLLQVAQTATYDHVIKADEILEQPFMNNDKRVYGMYYKVGGDAATNARFYVTDSTKHFVVASLYFYAKPNYDSIYPATNYIINDMRKMMESFEWNR
ncbi:MAG: gliding motility lipoprotein GldD [Flavobacterium sp.]|nr:gliding motility lipoprotein GldD [Candidatus Neoflavobacterium equi]